MKRWMLVCFAVLSLLVVVAGSVASPAAAAPGGNSENAKACHQGGWESLARTESPGTAFVGEEECVSYAAQGGTIVSLQVLPTSVIRVTQPFAYNYSVTGEGLLTGASLVFTSLYPDGSTAASITLDTVDGDGTASGFVGVGCSDVGDLQVQFTSITSDNQPIASEVFVRPGCA